MQAQAAGQPLLIGYSDITVLHACWRVRGWGPAIYGTLSESTADARQAESLMAFLKGEAYDCSSETEAAARVLRPGTAAAPLFAACLVVLANLCGTAAFPDLAGNILAIEDIDERPYAIDFALHQMYLAGKLDGIAGCCAARSTTRSRRTTAAQPWTRSSRRGPSVSACRRSAACPSVTWTIRWCSPPGCRSSWQARGDGSWHLHWPGGRPLVG